MNGMIMHQSIPAVPIPTPPSPGNRGAFAHVVSPGVGLSQILSRPGGWALANPGATPGHLTHVFSKDGWERQAFVKTKASRRRKAIGALTCVASIT